MNIMNVSVCIIPPSVNPCVKESKSLRPTEICPNPGSVAELLGGILENQMKFRLNLSFPDSCLHEDSLLEMIRRGL